LATQTLIAGTGADDSTVGASAWGNPSYVTANDANWATVGGTSGWGAIYDYSIKFVLGGTISGTELSAAAAWPTSATLRTFGSSSGTSGLGTLAPSDVNASGFGCVLAVANASSSPTKTSHYLKATNFGFTIPTGATINGVQQSWYAYELDSGFCFAPDTLVATPNGTKRIGEIGSGEPILSIEPVTLAAEVDKVVRVAWSRRVLGRLATKGRTSYVTAGHKYLLESGEWKMARDLQRGDVVLQLERGLVVPELVLEFMAGEKESDVVTFEVERNQTFFADGLAVHNASGTPSSQADVNYCQITVTYTAPGENQFFAFF